MAAFERAARAGPLSLPTLAMPPPTPTTAAAASSSSSATEKEEREADAELEEARAALRQARGVAARSRRELAALASELRAAGPALAPLAASVDAPRSPDFPSFFEFAFRYCLTDASQKIIDLATAREMLSLALPPEGRCHHRQALLDFLGQQREYKCLNADQWRGIGRFVREVGPGCADFDDDGAWPLLLDNYVEWVRKGGGKANAEGVK